MNKIHIVVVLLKNRRKTVHKTVSIEDHDVTLKELIDLLANKPELRNIPLKSYDLKCIYNGKTLQLDHYFTPGASGELRIETYAPVQRKWQFWKR
jgi:hypothetical protein